MAQPDAPIKLLRPIAEFLPPELYADLRAEHQRLMEAELNALEAKVAAGSLADPVQAAASVAQRQAELAARLSFHSAIAALQPLLDDMEKRIAALEGRK